MYIKNSRIIRLITLALFASPLFAQGQTTAKDLISALPKTITPGVNISYAAGSGEDAKANEPNGMLPVKTYVFADAEKFYIENDLASFLKVSADHPKFFELGTEFKIWTITLEKKDIEVSLVPQIPEDGPGASYVGEVKVMLGPGYQSKTPTELVAIINQMLKVGSVQTLKAKTEPLAPKLEPKGPLLSLDCTPNQEMMRATLREVLLDKVAQIAVFEPVGETLPFQKAMFTDAQIEWSTGDINKGGSHYKLSRSSGILTVQQVLNWNTEIGQIPQYQSVSYTCAIRQKKF